MKTISTAFKGYSPKVKAFFKDLKDNNNRDWFQEHKEFYENEIKGTSQALVSDMAERFAMLGMPYVADPKRSIFRIYRDIRFSPNKDPYKTNTGVFFPYSLHQTAKKPVESLGLYFHIDFKDTFIAGGIHMPPNDILKITRQRITEDWEELDKILKSKTFKKEYPYSMVGETLKKVPQGYPAEHPAADWLKLKEYTVYCDIDFKDTYTEGLMDILEKKAKAMAPFLEFFQVALEN
ncbi:MAG: DUF2461 domain-containing protein [FCB group bacterium]|jgi:uncharacterized protein (TIGR02453 family)